MCRSFLAVLMIYLVLFCCNGCGERGVDRNIKPEAYISQYDEFTALYGTERMAALKALGVDLQDVDNISHNRWGIARSEIYAGMEFEISTIFSGADYVLSGVQMEREYEFPAEKDALIEDAVKVCMQLSADFGEATDNSYFFNWVSVMMGEEWNRDIKFWQDPFVLERVVNEEYGGSLLCWDLTPVAPNAVKQQLGEARHGLVCGISVSEDEGAAYLTITY